MIPLLAALVHLWRHSARPVWRSRCHSSPSDALRRNAGGQWSRRLWCNIMSGGSTSAPPASVTPLPFSIPSVWRSRRGGSSKPRGLAIPEEQGAGAKRPHSALRRRGSASREHLQASLMPGCQHRVAALWLVAQDLDRPMEQMRTERLYPRQGTRRRWNSRSPFAQQSFRLRAVVRGCVAAGWLPVPAVRSRARQPSRGPGTTNSPPSVFWAASAP